MRTALIVGAAGTELSPDEVRFLKDARPAGFILFARNLKDHAQIRALISDVRAAIGADDVLVLIDQEGGRVQRLRPPLGRALPPAAAYGALYAGDREVALAAAFEATRLLAADLVDLGINTDCAPVLDLPVPGSHDIIGDRAYGRTVDQVVALAKAVADGFMAGGVVPVIKHIPGHGRATADSHLALPVVTEPREELIASDFAPFKALSHLPAAMSAHVVFRAIDPDEPASTSPIIIRDVIRGLIGFDGLLMSDDLSMKALSGPMRQRAEAVIAAGSDLALHCNGDMAEMVDAAAGSGRLEGRAKERFDTALNITKATQPFDSAAAEAQLAKVLAFAAGAAESV
ncbi:Beta-hexosaminidase [Hyphomicrobium sp. 1Nfss2.1]|uniref:beta-N-acetylhexosaminidase n=1 Tax=Hyphomicrobium sp. 1Nfss2.1 TaxID=3413936 RepID=UPI003C7C5B5C